MLANRFLIPVIKEVKKRRQIIMVTHSPNITVVCDAEQVIHTSSDRTNRNEVIYTSGSIESPQLNKHLIDVLGWLEPYLVDWMKAEMDWEFITPPDEVCRTYGRHKVGPDTGIVLEPRKVLVPAPPANDPKAIKWLESIGVEVVQVDCSSLVPPGDAGSSTARRGR